MHALMHVHAYARVHTHTHTNIPSSTGVGPVEHLMNGSNTIFTQWYHVTPCHNSIVHPRVTRQTLMLHKAFTKHALQTPSWVGLVTLANNVFPVPGGPYIKTLR